MKRIKIITIFLTLLFSLPLLAKAEMRLSASVDKDVVAINDTLRLTITVQSSSKVDTPTIPNMKDFDLYSAGQKEKTTWTNGKTSYYLQFSYVLTPKRIGKTQIPSIIIFEGHEKRLTPAINIEVLDEDTDIPPIAAKTFNNSQTQGISSERPNIDDLIFFTATTNKKSAYINEQINLSLKFYTSIPLISNPQYMAPKLEGFIPENLPPIRTGQTAKKGRTYNYHEIKTALFGIDKGIGIVNPASINVMIQSSNPQDLSGSGFFQHFFSRVQGEKKQIKSPRLKIKILPLPKKGQPASFNGAVGHYKISAALESTDIKAGEAVNLILTISGQGNFKTITMPELPEMSNFRIYDTVTSLSMNKDRDIIGGQKVFTTIMMPRISGRYKIKPIKFSFFNPKTKKYIELKTKALKIKVAKGQAIASSTDYYQGSKTNYSQIKTIATDIHYILENKKAPLSLKISQKIASVLWLNFTFLLILVGSLLFAYINGFRLKNPDLLKSKRAYKKSLKEIHKAETFAQEEKYTDAVSLLHNSLNAYLSAKLRNKTGALTIKKIIAQIKEKNPAINDNATADLKTLSDELEMLRFTPASLDKEKIDALAQNYEKTLKFFEKELK
jgi:oxygen tolerance protein BatD